MRKLLSLVKSITIVILLLIVASALLIGASPKTLLAFIPYVTPYQITADTLDIDWINPAVQATQLKVLTTAATKDSQQDSPPSNNTLVAIDSVSLQSTWNALLGEDHSITGEIKDGVIHADQFTTQQDESAEDISGSTGTDTQKVHELLSMLNVNLHELKIHIDQDKHLYIQRLEKLGSTNKQQQGITFSLHYQDASISLPLIGTLTSEIQEQQPHLYVELPELDLRALASNDDAKNTTTSENSLNDNDKVDHFFNNERPIDWQWIEPLTPLNLHFSSNTLQLPQGKLTELESHLAFNKSHQTPTIVQHHSGILQWQVSEAISTEKNITLPFAIDSHWGLLGKITTGADIKGKTSIRLDKEILLMDGTINLNGFSEQNITLKTSTTTLPQILDTLPSSTLPSSLKQQIVPLLPFSISGQLNTKRTDSNHHTIQIADLTLTAGESDINGNIVVQLTNVKPTDNDTTSVTQKNTGPIRLESSQFDVYSKTLVLPTFSSNSPNNAGKDNRHKESSDASQDAPVKKLFNNEPINVDWLNTINSNGTLVIEKLIHNNETAAEGITTRLSIKDKVLQLDTTIKQFASGTINANLSLDNTTPPLKLSTQGAINNLLLESLSVLPKDEFEGGKTHLQFSLKSEGKSTQAIASQLQGDFLLESIEGTLANNSFELIGSDLIINLLNTINPFHKKAKNTQLECAVIKANIIDGKVHFDDSIAVRTSKMMVVADGSIDLKTEKINLGINPKARSGVGVDIASLAKFVAMKGHLSQPSMGVSASGTLKSALNIGAAISTGGLSLIASGLVDKAITGDVCQTAKKAFTQTAKDKKD